jgi:hypothetical protein
LAGVQVWAPDGTILIDTNTSVALILGTFAIGGTGSPQSGSVTDARLANGRPYAFMLLGGIPGANNQEAEVTVSGTTVTWRYPNADPTFANRPAVTIMYGTF